jgi:hypothetical protein
MWETFMQTLDVNEPGLPDLQFVLMVLALCTSNLETLNVPRSARQTIFDRCWAMLHDEPPPTTPAHRVLDLRAGDALALQAMVEVVRSTLNELGIPKLIWNHPPSEPTRTTTPEALPLLERLEKLYPSPDPANNPEGQ